MEEQKKQGYMGRAEEKKQQQPMKQASGMPAEKPKTQERKETKPASAEQTAPKYGAEKPKQEEGKEKSYKQV